MGLKPATPIQFHCAKMAVSCFSGVAEKLGFAPSPRLHASSCQGGGERRDDPLASQKAAVRHRLGGTSPGSPIIRVMPDDDIGKVFERLPKEEAIGRDLHAFWAHFASMDLRPLETRKK